MAHEWESLIIFFAKEMRSSGAVWCLATTFTTLAVLCYANAEPSVASSGLIRTKWLENYILTLCTKSNSNAHMLNFSWWKSISAVSQAKDLLVLNGDCLNFEAISFEIRAKEKCLPDSCVALPLHSVISSFIFNKQVGPIHNFYRIFWLFV